MFPEIAIRTGDTPAIERARFRREAADILITTPESLFLLLTSNARERLTTIDTVIIDEIHALVPGKRGAHLALSLERLEASKADFRSALQRIGLSATQRPLDEVARFLGGAEPRAMKKPHAATQAVAQAATFRPSKRLKASFTRNSLETDKSPAYPAGHDRQRGGSQAAAAAH